MGKFLAGPVGSALRVALGSVLGSVVTLLLAGGSVSDLADVTFWDAALGLAITVAVPIIIAYLNTADPRYGKTEANTPPVGGEGGEVGVSLILTLVATLCFAVAFCLVLFKGGDARLIEEFLLGGLTFFAAAHLV